MGVLYLASQQWSAYLAAVPKLLRRVSARRFKRTIAALSAAPAEARIRWPSYAVYAFGNLRVCDVARRRYTSGCLLRSVPLAQGNNHLSETNLYLTLRPPAKHPFDSLDIRRE